MKTIKESSKPTIIPTTGMKIRGIDTKNKSVNFDFDELAKIDNFRGHVSPSDAVPADIQNGDWVRCKTTGTYTNFSGVTANAGNRLEYTAETTEWLVYDDSGSGDIALTSDMDANGHKITNLGDGVDDGDGVNIEQATIANSNLLYQFANNNRTINKFNKYDVYQGKIDENTGLFVPLSNPFYRCTGYVDITDCDYIYITLPSILNNFNLAFFTKTSNTPIPPILNFGENYTFTPTIDGIGGTPQVGGLFEVPTGCTRCRFNLSFGTDINTSGVMLEKSSPGGVGSIYVPFIDNDQTADIISLKEKDILCLSNDLGFFPVFYYQGNGDLISDLPYLDGNYALSIPSNTEIGHVIASLYEYPCAELNGDRVLLKSSLIVDKVGTWNFIDHITIGYLLEGNPNAVSLFTIYVNDLDKISEFEKGIEKEIEILSNYYKIYIAWYSSDTNSHTEDTPSTIYIKPSFLRIIENNNVTNSTILNNKLLINKLLSSQSYGYPTEFGAVYDGITDDSIAINTAIQVYDHVIFKGNGTALCADTIIVKENTWLDLDSSFTIKLADEVNKPLIKNKWAEQAYFMEKNLIDGNVPTFMPEVYPDYGTYPSANYILGNAEKNIKITGGILDGNGGNQTRQDYRYGSIGYWGIMLAIVNVDGFILSDIKLYDSCTYNADFCLLTNFEIKNVTFGFRSTRANIDGIHFDGECTKGSISNIFGRTNDDMVTFNGGDSWYPKDIGGTITPEANRLWYPFKQGKINSISVKNIFGTSSYRAIRLLSNVKIDGVSPVDETEGIDNIIIDGVYGTFRTDLLLISNHYGDAKIYGLIIFKNINAISSGTNNITIESCIIDSLIIDGMSYFATNNSKQMMTTDATIKSLLISNSLINANGEDLSALSMIENTGNIIKLKLINVVNKDANYLQTIDGTVTIESFMSDFN